MATTLELLIETAMPTEEMRAAVLYSLRQASRFDEPGPYDPECNAMINLPRLVFSGSRFWVEMKVLTKEEQDWARGGCGLPATLSFLFFRLSFEQRAIAMDEVAKACAMILSRPEVYAILGYDTGEMILIKGHQGRFRSERSMPEEFLPYFTDYAVTPEIPGF